MASPAVRTAPAVNGTPNKVLLGISLIDASGDKYTDTLVLTAVPANVDIEAYVASYQAVTQASIYNVSVSINYEGDIDADNADTMQRNSVKDGINMLWRDLTTLQSQSTRVIAPVEDVMQGNQDIPLLTFVDMITYIAETGDILTAYALQSAQYTERRERNNARISA